MNFLARTTGIVCVCAGSVMAQGRWELPAYGMFGPRVCNEVFLHSLALPCGSQAHYVSVRKPLSGPRSAKCCSPLTFDEAREFSVEADVNFMLCGVQQSIRLKGSTTQTTSNVYSGHGTCGCVQLFYKQDFRVRLVRKQYQTCTLAGAPIGSPIIVDEMISDPVPLSEGPVPYYYRDPTRCTGCQPNGRPSNPATDPGSAWDPNLPAGFPTVIPSALPQPDAIPWDPTNHGPSGWIPVPTSSSQVSIDLLNSWKPRQIESVFSLTLYECGMIMQHLRAAQNSSDGQIPDSARVSIHVTTEVQLTGTFGSLLAQLHSFAQNMVDRKIYCDFDGDGVRTSNDLGMLLERVKDPDGRELPEMRLYDVNGDGNVDEQDITKWNELVALIG